MPLFSSLNESVLGGEYEPFLPLLNWQCLTGIADTGEEQSVLRHMQRQGESAVVMSHIFLSSTQILMKLNKCDWKMLMNQLVFIATSQ